MTYTKQVWVDDDGSGVVGTVVSKARMDVIEQGIYDAQLPKAWGAAGPGGGVSGIGVTRVVYVTLVVTVVEATKVAATFTARGDPATADYLVAELWLDGAVYVADGGATNAAGAAIAFQHIVNLTPGAHTFEVKVRKTANAGGAVYGGAALVVQPLQ